MTLAVIPARGGSKRIPQKNIKPFCGKPIIAYSIEAALATGLFDQVVVSTDDDAIATVAKEAGAKVPFVRPAALSDDHTGTQAVIRHAVTWFGQNGAVPEYVCCLYATAPFIRSDDIQRGYQQLKRSNAQYVFSVTTFPFPIQRAVHITKEGGVTPFDEAAIAMRSQDLEEAYHDAAQFYWGKASAYRDDLPLYAPHSHPLILPRHRVQDIDTPEDWLRAEAMYRVLKETGI